MSIDPDSNRIYWDALADEYQASTRISTDDFHFGPLLPGNRELRVLPRDVASRTCLEIGCGGGQNSIYLAKQGARCTAIDISEQQLVHGRRLAATANVEVTFECRDMEKLADRGLGTFDLIHSTHALPFTACPERVVANAADMLGASGMMVLTLSHPVFAGEWLEVDGEGAGLFLRDYFHPAADVRFTGGGDSFIQSCAHPIGTTIDWLIQAGLAVESVLEPEPLPIPTMTKTAILERVPYDSAAWRELYEQIAHVPVVVIFVAIKEN